MVMALVSCFSENQLLKQHVIPSTLSVERENGKYEETKYFVDYE